MSCLWWSIFDVTTKHSQADLLERMSIFNHTQTSEVSIWIMCTQFRCPLLSDMLCLKIWLHRVGYSEALYSHRIKFKHIYLVLVVAPWKREKSKTDHFVIETAEQKDGLNRNISKYLFQINSIFIGGGWGWDEDIFTKYSCPISSILDPFCAHKCPIHLVNILGCITNHLFLLPSFKYRYFGVL